MLGGVLGATKIDFFYHIKTERLRERKDNTWVHLSVGTIREYKEKGVEDHLWSFVFLSQILLSLSAAFHLLDTTRKSENQESRWLTPLKVDVELGSKEDNGRVKGKGINPLPSTI